MVKPKVYLAGKINGYDDWRDEVLGRTWAEHECGGLVSLDDRDVTPRRWSQHDAGDFVRVGPYFVGCKHACPQGLRVNSIAGCGGCSDGPHGNADLAREKAAALAVNSIQDCDFVFAWMSDATAHGTLVEIGYAVGLGKPAFLAAPACPNPHVDCARCDSWFPWSIPGVTPVPWRDEPREAFEWSLDSWRGQKISFDSDVERQFWNAHCDAGRPIADLTPQHEITANGRNYRLDFYSPSHKKAIEVDGLAYHNGQKSFIRDRNRQRDLEMAGIRVLRFAAKEVMADAASCVRQAAQWAAAA